MSADLRCPQGHHWDWDDDEAVTADTVCPLCGSTYISEVTEHTIVQAEPPAAITPPVQVQGLPALPGYELGEQLGVGGMGAVYKARHVRTDRVVALKLPHATRDLTQRLRFQDEARAVARLQHAGIVQVFEVGDLAGQPFMALEYCSGGSLADRLKGVPLPPRSAALILKPIAEAVGHAHRAGVVHRDLKPANILLAGGESGLPAPIADLVPKVADFGLARRLDSELRHTQDGSVMGTASYMAPEQARGEIHAVGPPADVYALGAMLYELLTGRPPLRGATVLETLAQVAERDPVPPSRLQPTIPRDLETIALAALRKDPAKRYADGDALAADLARFLDGRPVLAHPVGWPERVWKRAKRNPLPAMLLAVLALSLVGGIGFGVWKQVRLTQERDRSQSHFQMSLRTIDELFTQVAEQDLATEPRAERTRQALLEKAHNFYKEILAMEAGDPAVAWEATKAARRVGDIDRLLGRYPEAIASYDEALLRLGKLRTGGREDDANWRETAHAYNWRGECQRLREQLADADADYGEAAGIYSRLGTNPLELAQSLNNRGIVAGVRNDTSGAEAYFNQADQLLAGDARPGLRQQAARVALNRSDVFRKANKPAEAVRAADAAAKLFDALIAERPERLEYQHERAAAGINLAIARFAAGDAAGAAAVATDARTRLENLSRLYPNTVLFLVDLGRVCTTLAQFAYDTDGPAAQRHTRAAIGHWEALLAKQSNVPAYHGELGIALGNLGRMTMDRVVLTRGIDAVLIALKANAEDQDFRQCLRQQTGDLAEVLAAAGEERAILATADRLNTALPGYGTRRAVCFLALAAKTAKAPDALLNKAVEIVRTADPAAVKGLLEDAECEPFSTRPAFRAAFDR